jgi:hypothetical protein
MSSSGSTETHSVSVIEETERYMVLDHEGNHEYDLVVINHGDYGRTINLSHSMSHQWMTDVRGELVLSMTDNGNGIKFDRKLKKLDYSELLYLRIMLNFEHQTTSNLLDRENYIVMAMSNEIHV